MHDDDNFETILDQDGRPARILRDRGRVRVSMTARDSSSPLPRAMTDASFVSDGTDNPLGLHRPGYRVQLADEIARLTKQEARDAYEKQLTNSWRDPDSDDDDNGGGVESPEGAACTVRGPDYPLDFGAPGHIVNGECVPDNPRGQARSDSRSVTQIARDHQRNMAKIYEARDRELSEMWRRR